MKLYDSYKTFAFALDPEMIHEITLKLLGNAPFLSKLNRSFSSESFRTKAKTMEWRFPLGIAAGLDKNAQMLEFFSNLGVGALEIGTVTPLAQEGNDKPRVWRLIPQESVRNAMGFPNDGSEIIKQRLIEFRNNKKTDMKIGVNIGKNKKTTNKNAHKDYKKLYEDFADISDYIVINVSSPNTPGLRELQNIDAMRKILDSILKVRTEDHPPLYIKISPDMNEQDLTDLYKLVVEKKLNGIIATNTSNQHDHGPGGISGKYIKTLAEQTYGKLLELSKDNKDIDIICVGGIDSYHQLKNIWKQGGHLVQIYTAFIYQGPQMFNQFAKHIKQDLKNNKVSDLNELINALRESD